MNLPPTYARPRFSSDAESLQEHRALILVLGVCLLVLGLLALGALPFVTAAYVLYLGFVLIVTGILSGVHAFQVRHTADFFAAVLIALLDVIVGLLMVCNVGESAAIITLLMAVFFTVGGLFRLVTAVAVRPPGWIWWVLSGVVSFLLGVSIWRQWPISSYWVIGLFIGIELLIRGWSLIMVSLALPSARGGGSAPPAAV